MSRHGARGAVPLRALTISLTLIGLVGSMTGCPGQRRVKDGVVLAGREVGGMSHGELRRTISELARGANRPARLARFEPKTGEVLPGAPGRRLDVAATEKRVLAAQEDQRVEVAIRPVTPPFAVRDLLDGPDGSERLRVLAAYRTPMKDARPGRMHNLRIAGRTISGTRLAPGQVFSFNGLVGAQPSPAQGYLPAPIIDDNGNKVMDYGGGLCQIATTLYNLALQAKLTIVERYPHSKPANYAPRGKDATVWIDKDLKFRNNRSYPVYLFVRVDRSAVRTWLARSTP